jgi:ceramide glucosyltransferase
MWVYSYRYLILLPALAPLLYYILALYATRCFFRDRNKGVRDPSFAPPVSILKPVRGIDHQAYENFASMCGLDYPRYEVLFAVADHDDPVLPVLERLARDFPQTSIRLIVGVPQVGNSHKTNSLCCLARDASYDFLVMNDSDVRVDKNYLWDVTAPFRDPGVGVVTALFRGHSDGSLVADLDAVGIPADAAARTILAWRFRHLDFALGWTMATTKQHLAEIGGFEALRDMHSDDFALGNELAHKGYRVELMRNPVGMVFSRQTMRQFLAHELRWSIQLRNLRPLGYLGMSVTFGFAWALLVAAVVPSWKPAIAYFAAYVFLRLALAWEMGVRGLDDPVVRKKPWLVFVRDAFQSAVYLASFFSNSIVWRGTSYKLDGAFAKPTQPTQGATAARHV